MSRGPGKDQRGGIIEIQLGVFLLAAGGAAAWALHKAGHELFAGLSLAVAGLGGLFLYLAFRS